jgi:hypothetical protein
MKHQMGDDNPIKHDKPVLDQPPPLLEIVSDVQLDFRRSPNPLEVREDIFRWSMIRHNPQRQ